MINNKIGRQDDPDGLVPVYDQQDKGQFDQFVSDLRAKRVRAFFYPRSGCDWMPIYRLSHMADLFVFVDWTVTEKEWNQAYQVITRKATPAGDGLGHFQIANPETNYQKLEAEIGPLGSMENLPWMPVGAREPMPAPWGLLAAA
ncbi:MAG TPA: hypothetical protein P5525_20410 [Candidatus Paceibacterota bacterium]|nr:hypothetical protein [Candidatus Paceibacterota bacterium]